MDQGSLTHRPSKVGQFYSLIPGQFYLDTQVNKAISDDAPCEYFGVILEQCKTKDIQIGNISDESELMTNLAENAIPDTANEDMKKASKEDLEAQRAEKAAEKKKAEKAAEKKKAEKEAAEERIEKAKVSTSESGEVSDEGEAVSTEGTVLDGASIDIVSSGITVSTGSVSEPAGKNVDVKV